MIKKRLIWTRRRTNSMLTVITAFILGSCGSTGTVQTIIDTIGPEPVAQSQFDTEDFIPMQRWTPGPLSDPARMPTSNLIVRVTASDTLLDIANRYRVSADSIARANMLRSYTIYPGQILNIPPY
jgi:hypothetical protein